jgi:hypothetical protein
MNGLSFKAGMATSMRSFNEPNVVGAEERNESRKSNSRYRAASQSAAEFLATLPRAALADSLALGYYRPPLSGLSVCGFADCREFLAEGFMRDLGNIELL